MADYRELLRVLENQRPGRAVFFEYTLNQSLAEQLVWRRGQGTLGNGSCSGPDTGRRRGGFRL